MLRRTAAFLLPLLATGAPASADPLRGPLAHTYSIVAHDPATGEIGVAVQSHWFQVGTVVAWAEAGVGAVATQSFVKVDYGPKGLDAMRAGIDPERALEALLATDPQRGVRQVAMIDAGGRVATWTGEQCIQAAGHHRGEHYSVQANLMDRDTVWPAIARAFEAATGDLAERMLAALETAEAEGGDIRGAQSASLIVVGPDRGDARYEGRRVDLRVDDSPKPLVEIRRLLKLQRAYTSMNAGDEAFAEGRVDEAVVLYRRAAELAPEVAELPFWHAVTLASAGQLDAALPIFRDVFARERRWAELVPRLPASGLLPDEPELLKAILAVAPQ